MSTGSPTPAAAVSQRRAHLAPWALLGPALAIVIIFFGLPMAQMARMSFNLHEGQRLYEPGFTFDHYVTLFTNPVFTGAIRTTVVLAIAASLAAVVLGYGFALLAWLRPARWRLAFIALALCPLLVSEIAIIFGWWMVFPKNGLLSHALLSAGLISDKISLMYTEFAAFVGLVYITLPYTFFIMLSILDGIERSTVEASGDLGASPLVTFREVLLPLSSGGLQVAFSQSIIWTMGTYATPSALGPDTLWTIGFLVQDQMLGKHNWPMASALAMALACGVALVVILVGAVFSRRTSFHV